MDLGKVESVPRSKGYRRKTRSMMRKKAKKGLSSLLREYKVNDKVVIDIDPSQVKGMPHRRFQGKVGVVKKVGRRALMIDVPMGDKIKRVIARLEHVKPHFEVMKAEPAKG